MKKFIKYLILSAAILATTQASAMQNQNKILQKQTEALETISNAFDIFKQITSQGINADPIKETRATKCWLTLLNRYLSNLSFKKKKLNTIFKSNYDMFRVALRASEYGYLSIIKYLFENRMQNNKIYDSAFCGALNRAAEHGNLKIIKYLYDKIRKDIIFNGVGCFYRLNSSHVGISPIKTAVEKGHTEIVKYLCENMIDRPVSVGRDNKTDKRLDKGDPDELLYKEYRFENINDALDAAVKLGKLKMVTCICKNMKDKIYNIDAKLMYSFKNCMNKNVHFEIIEYLCTQMKDKIVNKPKISSELYKMRENPNFSNKPINIIIFLFLTPTLSFSF